MPTFEVTLCRDDDPKVILPLTTRLFCKVVAPVTPKVPPRFVSPVILRLEPEILLEAEIVDAVRALATLKVPPIVEAPVPIVRLFPNKVADELMLLLAVIVVEVIPPTTCKVFVGDVVPIPTLPDELMVILTEPLVSNCKL